MKPGKISSEKGKLFLLSLGFLNKLLNLAKRISYSRKNGLTDMFTTLCFSRVGKQSFPRISLSVRCEKKLLVHGFKPSVKICQTYDIKVK